jgi:hypothetical protein
VNNSNTNNHNPTSLQESSEALLGFIYGTYWAAKTEGKG